MELELYINIEEINRAWK